MAKYLVTGGCGFIGSQLVEKLLSLGHEVTVIDDLSQKLPRKNENAHYIQANAADYERIAPFFKGLDGCFHLAARPSVSAKLEQWASFHESNLTTSLIAFRAAVEAGCIPVVYASSCAVYGNASTLPLKEGLLVEPVSGYACDKLATEHNAFFANHEYQLASIGLRFFNVYGPHQSPSSPYSGVITRFITQAIQDQPLTIFGDGTQTRDFIFVEDIVENLIFAMQNIGKGAEVVNLCTQKQTEINTLAHIIEKHLGKALKVEHTAPRAADVQDSCGSNQKMHRLGFAAKYDLEAGLRKTIDYFLHTKL